MKTFKLDNEPKIETGFKTPEHYFENFSATVMQQVTNEKPKVIPLFQNKMRIFMAVAAILVIGLLIPIATTFTSKSNELDTITIENYLAYESNLNQYDLIKKLDLEDLNKMENSIALEDEDIEDVLVTNSNLENLLLEK